MGCSKSKVDVQEPPQPAVVDKPPESDSRLPLNPRQVFRLQKSWKGIKRRMEDTGLEMFIRLVCPYFFFIYFFCCFSFFYKNSDKLGSKQHIMSFGADL